MQRDTFLGVDVGTTATKALLMDAEGCVLSGASTGYPLLTPALGRCEQRASDWWEAVVHVVRRVCADPELARSVRGISLSTQGGTVVPTDAGFHPLSNAIIWSDARCTSDKEDFDAALGCGYVYRKTGWEPEQGLPAMQIRRMRLTQPDLFDRAAYFLSVPDYILARLTGHPAVDLSNAGINNLADISTGHYDAHILEFVGIDESRLAPLVSSGKPIGTLTRAAAQALGLSESVVVTSGAHDQYAVALGAGICEAGDVIIGTGTAWVVTALSDAPDFDSDFAQSVSASEGKWGSILSVSTGGACLDWFRKHVAGAETAPLEYETLNALVSERDMPGSGGLRFYPYFTGASEPYADFTSRATFLGLDLSHDRGHIARAIMEGVACQTVWALRALEEHVPVQRLFLAGGATHSPVWTNMIAEIAGREAYVSPTAELGCIGAAMLAAVGCGAFRDTVEAARAMAPQAVPLAPDAGRVRDYRDVYEHYVRGAEALRAIYRKG